MLGFLGLWSSSKGMVLVPNLSGLTQAQAISAIQSAGLTVASILSTTSTSDSNLSNKVASQTPASGTLVDYETTVDLSIYNYVAVVTTTAAPVTTSAPPVTTTTVAPVTPAPATISNLTYTATSATTGTLTWTTTGETVLFTGSATNYPSPYNYGGATSYYPSQPNLGWGGRLVNMSQNQSYTVSVTVFPSGSSQTITFTHSYAVATTTTTTTLAPITTTTTTVAPLPTLPTPTLTYDTGWNVYPSSVYANVTVLNHSYDNTYTASLGTQNPENPEEFNLSGLTPNQSYTVNVTASRAGYTSSTGSITFAAVPGATPAPPTTTTTTTAGLYTIWSGCYQNGVTQGAGYGTGPTAAGWVVVTGTTATTGLSEAEIRALIGGGCSSTTTTTTAAPVITTTTAAPVATGTVYLSYCFNGTPTQDSFFVDENNMIAQDINQACASYTSFLQGLNPPATNISCSIVSMPAAPTGCTQTTTTTTTTSAPATTTTTVAPVSVPSGGSVTLSGSSTPGSVITASTSGWSGSPTSYSIKITTALSPNTPTFNDNAVASGTTSATYTITSGDAQSPVNIFKAFATATNAGGTSSPASSGSIYAAPAATTTTTTVAPTTTTTTTPVSNSTWYACCISGDPMSVSSSSQATANTLINNLCQSETGTSISGSPSQTPVSCNTTTAAPATTTAAPATTTAAPATTTAAPATTTAAPATTYCPSLGSYVLSSGYPGNCPGASPTTTAAPAVTTTAAPATTTAAPATTTEAPITYRICTSFNVSNGDCDSTGCDTGGCGQGAVCTNGQQRCNYL